MRFFIPVFIITALLFAGSCANIVPPSGGKKDVTPPKLLSITPADSSFNIRPKKIELEFDEYLQPLSDASSQVQLSPLLPVPLTITSVARRVIITIPDTLLLAATTYRITFGNAIRDLHEGNQYNSKGYTFSTGAYFDSLRIGGLVLSAPTGLPDTGAVVLLYAAAESDSAVARHKPLYVVHTNGAGKFLFDGLPARAFRLFALRDANKNLTYDGGDEWIAFHEAIIIPRSDSLQSFTLRTFSEGNNDTSAAAKKARQRFGGDGAKTAAAAPGAAYTVQADTGDIKRRTAEINKPLTISFAKKLSAFISSKVFLAYDSSGITIEAGSMATLDTARKTALVNTRWKDNTLYTLRLQKGFAKDSAGADLVPGRYTFRTKREEDYGTLRIHLPAKYAGAGYVLQVIGNEADTVWQKPVLDTMVALRYLAPGKFVIRVIEDRNRNGHWDAGDLFKKLQPEIVIPYDAPLMLKAGWDNIIDFETPPRARPAANTGEKAPPNGNRVLKPK